MAIVFVDFPEFRPNVTPSQMFESGIMGGCYFRPIISPITNKEYKNNYKQFEFLKDIKHNKFLNKSYDKSINRYGVKVGTSYEYWMMKMWIKEEYDPYGWIEWYCNFWKGRRTPDDKRQIKRWLNIAGKNGRFRKQLQRKINDIGTNDDNVFIRMRQTLLHWGYDTRQMKVKRV